MKESKRSENVQPLGNLVDRLMKAYQLDGVIKEAEILARWEEMMGKAVSLRTRNLFIKDKTLILEIDSSVMRKELAFGKEVIIQRVNQVAGEELINDVYFK